MAQPLDVACDGETGCTVVFCLSVGNASGAEAHLDFALGVELFDTLDCDAADGATPASQAELVGLESNLLTGG